MYEIKTDRDTRQLLDAFSEFYDGLIVEIRLHLPPSPISEREGRVRVEARRADGAWCSVALAVAGLRDYKFTEGSADYLVLSDGLQIHFLSDRVFVDFAPYSEVYDTEAALQRSRQFMVGRSCYVEVAEIA
jgi:hypothetical protein